MAPAPVNIVEEAGEIAFGNLFGKLLSQSVHMGEGPLVGRVRGGMATPLGIRVIFPYN
ncbi:hypothetical protein [Streptomyces sp. NPDC059142]|uniref:hypothetical protein n=1 Tax=Streptomyces sp. NPDC059142 TaxID=3346739 RepID=UPI0036CCA506